MIKTQPIKQKQDFEKYAGQWVAVLDDNKVIKSAKNFQELIQEIKMEKLPEKPAIFLVPRKDEGPYIL